MNWNALQTTVPGAAGPETIGTWDPVAKTISLPAGWVSVPNRTGPQIIIRPALRSVDIPRGWTVVSSPPTPTPPPQPQGDMDDLIARHNAFRATNGRPPLIADPRLMASAQDYAADMLRRGVLSHYGADGSTPWDRMAAHDYVWSNASENIAEGQTTNQEVMQSWEQSPGHAADMLGPYAHVGAGRAGTFWCVDFGSPK